MTTSPFEKNGETFRAMLNLMGPEACDGLVRHAMAEMITAAALERAN